MVFFLVMFLLLNGCFLNSVIGPGYAVDIEVSDIVGLKYNDIRFIDDIIANEEFTVKRVTPSDKSECVHFAKDSPPVQVGYCYDIKRFSDDTIQGIRNFGLLVSNDWEGKEPAIKQEIDRLGDVLYKALADRFGKENVKIERRRSGPPF